MKNPITTYDDAMSRLKQPTKRDYELAQSACDKRAKGSKATRAESDAFRLISRIAKQSRFWSVVTSANKADVEAMTGLGRNEMADLFSRHGLPYDGSPINLATLIVKYHQLAIGTRNNRGQTDAKQRAEELRVRELEIKIAEREGKLVDAEACSTMLNAIFAHIHRAAETLQRNYSDEPEIALVLTDALDAARREVDHARDVISESEA